LGTSPDAWQETNLLLRAFPLPFLIYPLPWPTYQTTYTTSTGNAEILETYSKTTVFYGCCATHSDKCKIST